MQQWRPNARICGTAVRREHIQPPCGSTHQYHQQVKPTRIYSYLKRFLLFDFDPEIHFQGQSVLCLCSYMLSRCDGYIEANEEIIGRLLHFIMQGKQSQESKKEQLISLYTGHPDRKNKRVTNRTAPLQKSSLNVESGRSLYIWLIGGVITCILLISLLISVYHHKIRSW